jgi:16S rRNA (cytidine1402-2'-O)-methyltransferase
MTKVKKPALLLLPNLLGEHKHPELFLPSSVGQAVLSLDGLIAESEYGGRRYLKRFHGESPVHHIPLAVFNRDTPDGDIDFMLQPIKHGERWGYVSDAGLPCIADPGSKLVARARQLGIVVQAFVGPSSILMALMLSGMQGQNFTFHGYLSGEDKQIKQMEHQAGKVTQIFMEAPFRNDKLLKQLLRVLDQETKLCVAWDLTLPTQGVLAQTVAVWHKSPLPNLNDKPAIFLIGA